MLKVSTIDNPAWGQREEYGKPLLFSGGGIRGQLIQQLTPFTPPPSSSDPEIFKRAGGGGDFLQKKKRGGGGGGQLTRGNNIMYWN